jgi:two-component system sensor histidine kinase/response regulator
MQNNRVLIVDDNPKNIQLLANILSDNEYHIEYALNGKDAVAWVKEEEFDIILLDIMMPELDGFETCNQIKRTKKNKNTPIVFLTAHDDIDIIKKAFETGGVDYFTKPYSREKLLAQVSTHIELYKSRQKLKELNFKLKKQVKEQDLIIKEANNELKILNNSKNEILAFMSHELRTSLNGIVGAVNILNSMEQELNTSEELQQIFSLLNHSTNRLERYSFYAMSISKIKCDIKLVDTFSEINIPSLLSDCFAKYTEEHDNVHINTKIDDLKHKTMRGSASLISKTLIALVEVSLSMCKHSPVDISFETKKGKFAFKIEDLGSPNEDIIINNNSFQHSIHQLCNKRSSFIELYFAKLVATLHHGNLFFITNEKGTQTIIHLPLNLK